MRNLNPIENTGMLVMRATGDFIGTCFIFRYSWIVLTAAHCVRGAHAEDLHVIFPNSRHRTPVAVREIFSHPHADVALLNIGHIEETALTWPFDGLFDDQELGLDVYGFGFPSEAHPAASGPVPRILKTYVQRFFAYQSPLGYEYFAAEVSGGISAGMSGSPMFDPTYQGRLYGVLVENLRTSTTVSSITDVLEDGTQYKEVQQDVIYYGIAVWLPAISQWLDQVAPPVPHDEVNRRARNQANWRAEEGSP